MWEVRHGCRGTKEPSPINAISDAEPLLQIGKVAKQYDVTLRTLRFYETSDLLHPIHRGTTRLYRKSDCHRIKMILHARQLGFSIAEIHELLRESKSDSTFTDLISKLSSEKMLSKTQSLEKRRNDLDQALHDLRKKYELMHQRNADSE